MAELDEKPETGETFTAKIGRISGGNGIIECKDGPINIGPVTDDAVGEQITAKMVGSVYAVCKTSDVVTEHYWREYGWLISPQEDSMSIDQDEKSEADTSQPNPDHGEVNNYKQIRLENISKGDIFTAVIDRVTGSGNGIVKTKKGHINIGPVTEDAAGKEITAKMDSGTFARCLTKDVRVENYEIQYGLLRTPADQPSAKNPLRPVNDSSVTQDSGSIFCSRCSSIMYPSRGGSRVCPYCGYEEQNQIVETKTETKLDAADKPDESKKQISICDESDEGIKPKTTIKEGFPSDSNTTLSEEKKTTHKNNSEMRKKAIESAVEEVPEGTSNVQHNTPTYNRSQAVKEYVKSRANGVCEGCGEPAPFTSKTGEPYLHAHHINELSDGGSDTPDTVIALCPNCHYRVHHGKGGDEYNEELLKIVQEKENNRE